MQTRETKTFERFSLMELRGELIIGKGWTRNLSMGWYLQMKTGQESPGLSLGGSFFSLLFFFVFPEISTDGQTYELVYLTRLSSSRACWCAFKTRHHHQNVIIGMRLRCWRSCGGSGLLCFAMVMSTTIVFVWPASAALRKTLADCG